jgi:hypothetical protein
MKSWNLVVNASEQVEVPKKTTSAPSTKKRRTETTRKDTTSKANEKGEIKSSSKIQECGSTRS